MTNTSFDQCCQNIANSIREKGVRPGPVDAVLCEDGRTVMVYFGDEIAHCFAPDDPKKFDDAETVTAVLAYLANARRPKLVVVNDNGGAPDAA